MKRLILTLLLLAFSAIVVAQDAPKYDPATETTLHGIVVQIKDFECPISGTVGRHMEVKLADGSIVEVHLAPAKYMDDYKIVVTSEPVMVIGSKVTYHDAPAVIARTFSQKITYELRDTNGKPYW